MKSSPSELFGLVLALALALRKREDDISSFRGLAFPSYFPDENTTGFPETFRSYRQG